MCIITANTSRDAQQYVFVPEFVQKHVVYEFYILHIAFYDNIWYNMLKDGM